MANLHKAQRTDQCVLMTTMVTVRQLPSTGHGNYLAHGRHAVMILGVYEPHRPPHTVDRSSHSPLMPRIEPHGH